jgi:hypothetical protein
MRQPQLPGSEGRFGDILESERLYNNSGSITENLGGANHRPGVVTDADNGVCTQFARVRNHQLKGFLACGFTYSRAKTLFAR